MVDGIEIIGEHEGDDGHQLHENVQSRTGGILEEEKERTGERKGEEKMRRDIWRRR